MAVNIPQTAIRQPSDQLNKDSSGLTGFSVSWKGPYEDLETASSSVEQGDTFEGKTVSTVTLTTIPGGWGLLTINFTETSETAPGSGGLVPISDKWSIKSCRNDVSIMAYCGDTDDNPNRTWIECWMKESNPDVARAGGFTKPDGTVAELASQRHNQATSELMCKIERGIESVMRFYPIVTRRRVYSNVPGDLQERIGFIDTPAPGAGSKAPVGLTAYIAKYQWLKCQDDFDPTEGNTWTRTESWMGILKTEDNPSPWDEDLYGDSRWSMPHSHAEDTNPPDNA